MTVRRETEIICNKCKQSSITLNYQLSDAKIAQIARESGYFVGKSPEYRAICPYCLEKGVKPV